MGSKKPDNTLALWGEAEATQADSCDLVNPGPQTLYKGTSYPIKGNRWPAGILWRPAGGKRYPEL